MTSNQQQQQLYNIDPQQQQQLYNYANHEYDDDEDGSDGLIVTNPYVRLTALAASVIGYSGFALARTSLNHQLALEHPPRETPEHGYEPTFKGAFQAAKLIFKEEGISGFFKGSYPYLISLLVQYIAEASMVEVVPENILESYDLVETGFNEQLLYARDRFKNIAIYHSFISVTEFFSYPLQTIAVKMKSQKPISFSSSSVASQIGLSHHQQEKLDMFSAAMQIYNQGGFKAFYRGFDLFVLARWVEAFAEYGVREVLMDVLGETPDNDSISSTVASLTSRALTAPIDLVRLRLQSQDETYPYGTVDCVKQIYKYEGFKGFYKGTWLYLFYSIFGK